METTRKLTCRIFREPEKPEPPPSAKELGVRLRQDGGVYEVLSRRTEERLGIVYRDESVMQDDDGRESVWRGWGYTEEKTGERAFAETRREAIEWLADVPSAQRRARAWADYWRAKD